MDPMKYNTRRLDNSVCEPVASAALSQKPFFVKECGRALIYSVLLHSDLTEDDPPALFQSNQISDH